MADVFPSFKAGDETWTVASDGKVLLLRGSADIVRTKQHHAMDSLLPIQAISSLRLSAASSDSADVHMRVWDGDEIAFGVLHSGDPDVVTGLVALQSAVRMVNAAWPLSGPRAAAARGSVAPGYIRDKFMLGAQGVEEFWSTLSELPWEFANQWREAGMGASWPVAVAKADLAGDEVLIGLLPDRLVLVDGSRTAHEVPFSQLEEPCLFVAPTTGSAHEWIGKQSALAVQLKDVDGRDIRVALNRDEEVRPFYRFLLFRWAEALVSGSASPVDALQSASEKLSRGEMAPQAFAAVVDSVVAAESGVALSLAYPPMERNYLRPAEKPLTPKPTPQTTSVAQAPTKRSGPSARQVAAGAAAGAALWNLFAD